MKRSRSVYRCLPLALPFVAMATPATFAAPMFVDSIGQPGDPFSYVGNDLIEARFRADTTNWDLRLENNGNPVAGDNQAHLANGRGAFEGRSFDFSLSYNAGLDRLDWSVSRFGGGPSNSLSFDTSGLDSFNTLQFSSSGSRASVDVTNLVFTGFDAAESPWPSLSVSPAGPRFAQNNLFFGNDANLLSSDWQLSGRVALDDFTRNNPSEGSKINARLAQVQQIPGPAGITGLLLATGYCVVRRRRF